MDVAHADVALVHAGDGEVLAHRPGIESQRRKLRRPRGVMTARITIHGFFRAAVHGEIGLGVAVQPLHRDRDFARPPMFDKTAGLAFRPERSDDACLNGF